MYYAISLCLFLLIVVLVFQLLTGIFEKLDTESSIKFFENAQICG